MKFDLRYVNTGKIVCALILFIIGLGLFGYNSYVEKGLEADRKALKKITTEFTTLQSDIAKIQDDLVYLSENREKFDVLDAAGFFFVHDAPLVEEQLNEAVRISGLLRGNFRAGAPVCFTKDSLKDTDYVVMSTPISIKVDSYEDSRVYHFLDLFMRSLPGYIILENLSVARANEITGDVLLRIGTGEDLPLISSDINFNWYTIVKKESVRCLDIQAR